MHEWEADALYALVRTRVPLSRSSPRADLEATAHAARGRRLTRAGVRGHAALRSRERFVARSARRALGGDYFRRGRSGNALYKVVVEPEGHVVGTLDEDFAVESMAGDVFLLGTHSWKILRVEAGIVRVEDAHGAPPSIPFWNG